MIRFENVSFTYPEAGRPALRDVSLHVPQGSLALVVGPSGSGKSTLLRCTNGLVPHFSGGHLQGTIRVGGLDPVVATPRLMSRHVGFVFQDPEAQFVLDRVEDEVAFALENVALPPTEMESRVGEALAWLELLPLRNRRLETLSGGEKQRVAIAAALALRPRLLALDEPTSQLDPGSAAEVLEALLRLNRELGLTVLLAEHRLERVLPFADLLIHLDADRPGALCGPPREVLPQIDLVPPLVTLGKALGWEPLPLTLEEAREYTSNVEARAPEPGDQVAARPPGLEPYIQAQDVEVRYGERVALRGVSLELYPGEILALMGPNGAGKTTLLRSLVGLVRLRRGRVRVAGEDIAGREVAEVCRLVAYLPQDPNALLFADTVMEELLTTLRNYRWVEGGQELSSHLLERLGLGDKADAYPRDLSAGERQRVALGAVTVTHPGALLLDEPTRGLDYAAKRALLDLLRGWRDEGMAILLVTHDVELVAAAADRVALLDQGALSQVGQPAQVLADSLTFAPQVARLFPGTGWLTPEDVLGKNVAS